MGFMLAVSHPWLTLAGLAVTVVVVALVVVAMRGGRGQSGHDVAPPPGDPRDYRKPHE
jgi:hypothetical protein